MHPENGNERKTLIFRVSEENFDAILDQAAGIIKKGGTVAFPTETVYGLGADGLNPEAVRKIFQAKERPAGNPLSLLVHSREDVLKVAQKIPDSAFRLMDTFWPGPLTIILEKKEIVPEITSGNLPSIGVRMPDHKIPLELVKRAGVPLAAPSANLSGKPSSSLASHVIADLTGRIDIIIDGGETPIGLESTVIDMTVEPPVVLRPGAIGTEELEKTLGKIRLGYKDIISGDNTAETEESKSELLAQAGQKYRHYVPDTKVVLVEGNGESVPLKILELIENYRSKKQKVGFLLSFETAEFLSLEIPGNEETFLLGSRKEPEMAARKFFDGLRNLDKRKLDIIIADGSFSQSGLGTALINRLREASSLKFII